MFLISKKIISNPEPRAVVVHRAGRFMVKASGQYLVVEPGDMPGMSPEWHWRSSPADADAFQFEEAVQWAKDVNRSRGLDAEAQARRRLIESAPETVAWSEGA